MLRRVYGLCKELGIWDVHGFLRRCSWDQLSEWFEFMRLEPFGDERDDVRVGYAAAGLATVFATSQGANVTMKPSMFIPDWGNLSGKAKKAGPLTSIAKWRRMKAEAKAYYGGGG